MSMHRTPLTAIEREGLEAHGLAIGKPSQLSDCFRLGIRFAQEKASAQEPTYWMNDNGNTILNGMKKSYPNASKEYHLALYISPKGGTDG